MISQQSIESIVSAFVVQLRSASNTPADDSSSDDLEANLAFITTQLKKQKSESEIVINFYQNIDALKESKKGEYVSKTQAECTVFKWREDQLTAASKNARSDDDLKCYILKWRMGLAICGFLGGLMLLGEFTSPSIDGFTDEHLWTEPDGTETISNVRNGKGWGYSVGLGVGSAVLLSQGDHIYQGIRSILPFKRTNA